MKFSITWSGVKELKKQFRESSREADKRMRRATRQTANDIRRDSRRILAANRRNPSEFGNYVRDVAKGIRYRMRGTSAVLTFPFPSQVIEHGTQPFFPPPDALRDWAGAKLGDPHAAYPVAVAISERGFSPTPFIAPAIENNRRPHRRRVERALFSTGVFRG